MKKNFFIAYKFSGEDMMTLSRRIRTVQEALATHGIKAYATLAEEERFKEKQLTIKQIFDLAFQKINAADGLFVLQAGNERSEGQLVEIGYALAKNKPIIVARKLGVKSYIHEFASHDILYTDLADLSRKIQDLAL